MATREQQREARAEAAAWLARLHGPDRTRATDSALQSWLAASEENRRAFSLANEVWDLAPGATRQSVQAWYRNPARFALAATFVAVLLGGLLLAYLHQRPDYRTGVGQQQVASLEDGTLIALNTDSAVRVSYARNARSVRLDHGEAMFEVAHQPQRPFIVTAGRERIVALGTRFIVRYDRDGQVSVTLLEGSVRVSGGAPAIVLKPGQRAISRPDAPVSLDRPDLDTIVAWRRGETAFEDASVKAAAEEINRYNTRQIVIGDENAGDQRVSGAFISADPLAFARAMAELHNLELREAEDVVILQSRRS